MDIPVIDVAVPQNSITSTNSKSIFKSHKDSLFVRKYEDDVKNFNAQIEEKPPYL